MKYVDYQYISHNHVEHEVHAEFNYGARGSKRAKKRKPTPLQIIKQNHWKKVNSCRRTIQMNFKEGDLWVTLAYKKGTRKEMKAFQKDVKVFQDMLRELYGREGQQLKWIRRLEIGKRGGLHAHYVINNIDNAPQMIQACWKKAVKDAGRVYFTTIDEENGFEGLAEYICKDPTEEIQGQLSFLTPESRKKLVSISSSRNLDRPSPVKRTINPWSIRDILTGQRTIRPTEGFYIEKDSIKAGINKYTGLPYLRYRESRIKKDPPKEIVKEIQRPKPAPKPQKKPTIIDKVKGFFKKLRR